MPLRDYRVKGHPLQRQVAGVAPLMECVGWHQHGIPFGDRILFAVTEQGAVPLQDIDDVLPGVRVAAAVRVADGAWSHGTVVEHHISGHAVPGVEYPAAGFRVQVPIITYHPQSGWFEDTPLKGGTEEGYPLKGVHEGTCLIEAGPPAWNHSRASGL